MTAPDFWPDRRTAKELARFQRAQLTDNAEPPAPVYNPSGGGSGKPTSPPSALTAWYKADGTLTKDGSNLVSQWNDETGHGEHMVQATGANRPLWVPNALNGLPALRGNGTSQSMSRTFAARYTGTALSWAYAARRLSFAVGGGGFVCVGSFGWTSGADTGVGQLLAGFDDQNAPNNHNVYRAGAVAPCEHPGYRQAPLVVSGVMDGESVVHALNGQARGETSLGSVAFAQLDDPFAIDFLCLWGRTEGGSPTAPTRWAHYEISEFMFYRGAWTLPERLQAEQYLSGKYAVPIAW